MKNVSEQKIKLEQKKNRLIAEETRLKLKERKMRTRHLIEMGGLIVKAELDYLPINTLYGALLSIATSLEKNPVIKDEWTKIGKTKLNQEQQNKTAVILKFEQEPTSEIRKIIRNHGLKWNKFRAEWYGECYDLASLKHELANITFKLEEL
jgi:hypothetical protein